MKPRCDISKFSKGRLVRAVAVLFLLHTGADLVFPQLCNEEPVGITMNQSFSVAEDPVGDYQAVAASVPRSNESSENPRRKDPPKDEDCFCCCSHVLPGTITAAIAVTDIPSHVTRLEYLSVLSPPLARAFHPPRFA